MTSDEEFLQECENHAQINYEQKKELFIRLGRRDWLKRLVENELKHAVDMLNMRKRFEERARREQPKAYEYIRATKKKRKAAQRNVDFWEREREALDAEM